MRSATTPMIFRGSVLPLSSWGIGIVTLSPHLYGCKDMLTSFHNALIVHSLGLISSLSLYLNRFVARGNKFYLRIHSNVVIRCSWRVGRTCWVRYRGVSCSDQYLHQELAMQWLQVDHLLTAIDREFQEGG